MKKIIFIIVSVVLVCMLASGCTDLIYAIDKMYNNELKLASEVPTDYDTYVYDDSNSNSLFEKLREASGEMAPDSDIITMEEIDPYGFTACKGIYNPDYLDSSFEEDTENFSLYFNNEEYTSYVNYLQYLSNSSYGWSIAEFNAYDEIGYAEYVYFYENMDEGKSIYSSVCEVLDKEYGPSYNISQANKIIQDNMDFYTEISEDVRVYSIEGGELIVTSSIIENEYRISIETVFPQNITNATATNTATPKTQDIVDFKTIDKNNPIANFSIDYIKEKMTVVSENSGRTMYSAPAQILDELGEVVVITEKNDKIGSIIFTVQQMDGKNNVQEVFDMFYGLNDEITEANNGMGGEMWHGTEYGFDDATVKKAIGNTDDSFKFSWINDDHYIELNLETSRYGECDLYVIYSYDAYAD